MGIARDELAQGVGDVHKEGLGQTAGGHRPERIAIQAGLVGGDVALLSANAQADGAPFALELGEQRSGVDPLEHTLGQLGGGEVAHMTQNVMQTVPARGPRHLRAVLEVVFDPTQGVGVDQLAQLLLAEQLAQQVAVERQGGGSALGARGVALVHIGGDVVEQQRGGKRRGGLGLDLHQRDLAGVQPAQKRFEAGHVEDVAQALPVGLEDDREVGVAAGHLEQVLGLQALLPQRRAFPGVGAGDQQGARGVLAKARAEQSRAAQLGGDGRLNLVGLEQQQLDGRGQRLCFVGVEVGKVQHDAVVGPDGVSLQAEALADAGREGQAPGGVDTTAVGGEDAQAPVADLVAEALEHDRALARQHPGGGLLLAQVVEQVAARRARRDRSRAASVSASCSTAQREKAPIASPSSLGRPIESPFQKGTAPGAPGAGVTITRSRVISSIRQLEAPSRKACPGRAS